jgi:hypothetical protein
MRTFLVVLRGVYGTPEEFRDAAGAAMLAGWRREEVQLVLALTHPMSLIFGGALVVALVSILTAGK